jgi:aryl-alcohol dehydrogenase-like predicted oxidoreductase
LAAVFLSGKIQKFDDLPADDWRHSNPRFTEANFQANFKLVREVKALTDFVGATPIQMALAWVLKQGDNIVPIPGTKRIIGIPPT